MADSFFVSMTYWQKRLTYVLSPGNGYDSWSESGSSKVQSVGMSLSTSLSLMSSGIPCVIDVVLVGSIRRRMYQEDCSLVKCVDPPPDTAPNLDFHSFEFESPVMTVQTKRLRNTNHDAVQLQREQSLAGNLGM